MKQEIKRSQIFITLVLLVFAILCVTNVTYSYFTATESLNDDVGFGDLNVQFVYLLKGQPYQESTQNSKKIELYSVSGPIQQNVEFDLGVKVTENGTTTIKAVDSIAFKNLTGSCDCYVRFWINAYVVTDSVVDESVDYGKYFFWGDPDYPSFVRTTSSDLCYYYFVGVVKAGNSTYPIENTLKLQNISDQDKVPAEILGEQLKIVLNLQAVQVANGAYVDVFNDDAGCYEWEN